MRRPPTDPKFDKCFDLEVGDTVWWIGHGGGKKSTGTIIAEVPAYADPQSHVPDGYRPCLDGYGRPRDHISFLVANPGSRSARWPRVRNLSPTPPPDQGKRQTPEVLTAQCVELMVAQGISARSVRSARGVPYIIIEGHEGNPISACYFGKSQTWRMFNPYLPGADQGMITRTNHQSPEGLILAVKAAISEGSPVKQPSRSQSRLRR